MATTPKRPRPRPTATTPSARQLEKRLAALERVVESLEKAVGDLKYEVEQMRED